MVHRSFDWYAMPMGAIGGKNVVVDMHGNYIDI